jgi:pimeloyl-ACP methyl ester carboxylesterase
MHSAMRGDNSMSADAINTYPVRYGTATVDGARIFYREVGNRGSPAVVLLHDFPTTSRMYRNLLPALADGYYVIEPDYPGYADSDAPNPATFRYSFERISALINGLLEQKLVYSYAMYVAGYGAPLGWRLALAHPERISALMIQNGNTHEGALQEFWNPANKYWADTSEENRRDLLGWMSLYPKVQAYLRERQPPTLLIWGKQDRICAAEGTHAYKRDLKDLESHALDIGHFVLKDPVVEAFTLIRDFLDRRVQLKPGPGGS